MNKRSEKALKTFKFLRKQEETQKNIETQSQNITHMRKMKKNEEDEKNTPGKLHSKKISSATKKTPGKVQKKTGGSQKKKKFQDKKPKVNLIINYFEKISRGEVAEEHQGLRLTNNLFNPRDNLLVTGNTIGNALKKSETRPMR